MACSFYMRTLMDSTDSDSEIVIELGKTLIEMWYRLFPSL